MKFTLGLKRPLVRSKSNFITLVLKFGLENKISLLSDLKLPGRERPPHSPPPRGPPARGAPENGPRLLQSPTKDDLLQVRITDKVSRTSELITDF